MATMRALRKIHKGADGVKLFHDFPVPEPGPGEVLIRIVYAALCGTDLHVRHDVFPAFPPVTIGHEYSGVIAKVGEGVTEFAVGDRVISLNAAKYCGHCSYCRQGLQMLCNEKRGLGTGKDGAFADYMVYQADRVFKMPANLTMKAAAISEPLACVVRGVLERATVRAGDYVYVSGPGVMGQFAAQLAKLAGAHVTVGGTGIDGDRLTMALKLGADNVVDVTAEDPVAFANRVTNGHMYDVAFECSASPRAMDTCIDVLRKTGHLQQIALYGKSVPMDLDKMLMKEITFSNSYSAERSSWELLLNLMSTGKLHMEEFCSVVMDLEDWEEAMRLFEKKVGYKILFQLSEEP